MVPLPALWLLAEPLAVCRLDPQAPLPPEPAPGVFYSVTRTPAELSIICPATAAPAEGQCESGWRAFKLEGPLDFSMVGILAGLAAPLAQAQIPLLAVGTYLTDYLLVKEIHLEAAVAALTAAGYSIRRM